MRRARRPRSPFAAVTSVFGHGSPTGVVRAALLQNATTDTINMTLIARHIDLRLSYLPEHVLRKLYRPRRHDVANACQEPLTILVVIGFLGGGLRRISDVCERFSHTLRRQSRAFTGILKKVPAKLLRRRHAMPLCHDRYLLRR